MGAGDWDIYGHAALSNTGNNLRSGSVWMSTTSATLPDAARTSTIQTAGVSTFNLLTLTAPTIYQRISGTTTVYLSVRATFVAGTTTSYGKIWARRVR